MNVLSSLFMHNAAWFRDVLVLAFWVGAVGAVGVKLSWTLTAALGRVVFIIIGKILDVLNGNAWEGEAKDDNAT